MKAGMIGSCFVFACNAGSGGIFINNLYTN